MKATNLNDGSYGGKSRSKQHALVGGLGEGANLYETQGSSG
jgi:hypothetical protein